MNFVDAVWEKRNLDASVVEFLLHSDDIKNWEFNLSEILEKSTGRFSIVKVPCGSLPIVHGLEDLGFRFLETQLTMCRTLHAYQPAVGFRRLLSDFSFFRVDKKSDEFDKIIEQISPEMFTTDRISLDPYWGIERHKLAASRYKFWINDLMQDSNFHMINCSYKGKCIGFNSFLRQGEGVISGVLGGVFPTISLPGAGLAIANSIAEYCKYIYKKLFVYVSTNNPPIIRVYESLGFHVDKIVYVFRKTP